MKKFPYIGSVALVSIDGVRKLDAKGEQETWTQLYFLLGRLADPAFAEGKEGLEAVSFAVVARLELTQQEDFAKQRGIWLLEDDRADALERAVLKPKQPYNLQLAVPIEQLAAPLKQLTPYKPEAEAPAAASELS